MNFHYPNINCLNHHFHLLSYNFDLYPNSQVAIVRLVGVHCFVEEIDEKWNGNAIGGCTCVLVVSTLAVSILIDCM